MKKLLTLFSTLLFSVSALAQSTFVEGLHYDVIQQKANHKLPVMEFFSYGCPACYRVEPIAKNLTSKLPKGVKLTKVHVDFLGFASPEIQRAITKAMFAAKALKVGDKVSTAIFEHLHKARKRIKSEDDIRQIFAAQGITAAQYDKAMKSFSINGMFKKNQKLLSQYKGKISGVPSFVVKGKYKINLAKLPSVDALPQIVNQLLNKKD